MNKQVKRVKKYSHVKLDKTNFLPNSLEYYIYYIMNNFDNILSAKEFVEKENNYYINPNYYKLLYEEKYLELKDFILNNPLALEIYIYKTKDISLVNNIKILNINERLIDLIFELGYKIDSNSALAIKHNPYSFFYALNSGADLSILKYSKIGYSHEGLIRKMFDMGYKISASSYTWILNSELAFTLALKNGADINIINYSDFDLNPSEEFIKLIFSSKYNYTIYSNSPKFIFESRSAIEYYLEKNKNKELDLRFLNKINFDVDGYFLNKIFEYGYRIDYLTPDIFLEDFQVMREYYHKYINKDVYSDNFLKLLNNNYGLTNSIVGTFKNLDFLKITPLDKQLEIIKYVYFNHSYRTCYRKKFVTIINSGIYQKFIHTYNNLYSKWDINYFLELVDKYEKYIHLFDDIYLNNYSLKDNEKRLIRMCFKNNIIINSISSLNKLSNSLYINNYNLINSSDTSIIELKDIIFKIICNKSYDEMSKFINEMFNIYKYNELYTSISNKELLLQLESFKVIIESLEKLYYSNNYDSLLLIANELNEDVYKNNNSITSNLDDIDNYVKYFYGEEINEKITNISSFLNNKEDKYIVVKNKYSVPYTFTLDGKEVKKDTLVNYIELQGIPFILLAHTINAYGNGGSISSFYNKKLVGKSYICLSALDDLRPKSVVYKECKSINDVTILFDELDSNKLISFSYEDLESISDDNSLYIEYKNAIYNTVRKTILLTTSFIDSHNEYLYYREGLKPKGILVYDEANINQIMAAAYLDVPIVRINIKYYSKDMSYIEEENYEENMKEYYKNNYNKINNLGNTKKLSKDFFTRYCI